MPACDSGCDRRQQCAARARTARGRPRCATRHARRRSPVRHVRDTACADRARPPRPCRNVAGARRLGGSPRSLASPCRDRDRTAGRRHQRRGEPHRIRVRRACHERNARSVLARRPRRRRQRRATAEVRCAPVLDPGCVRARDRRRRGRESRLRRADASRSFTEASRQEPARPRRRAPPPSRYSASSLRAAAWRCALRPSSARRAGWAGRAAAERPSRRSRFSATWAFWPVRRSSEGLLEQPAFAAASSSCVSWHYFSPPVRYCCVAPATKAPVSRDFGRSTPKSGHFQRLLLDLSSRPAESSAGFAVT